MQQGDVSTSSPMYHVGVQTFCRAGWNNISFYKTRKMYLSAVLHGIGIGTKATDHHVSGILKRRCSSVQTTSAAKARSLITAARCNLQTD